MVTDWRCGEARASEQSVPMQVRRSERFTILITHQAVTDGRTRSAALLAMMIQTDVTSDSSLLRATCENRLRPSLCQSGLCRTEL